MRISLLVPLLLAAACSQDPYIAQLSGNWSGDATNANDVTVKASAQFRYDEEADEARPFSGSLDIGGWIYVVDQASSDNQGATVDLVLNTEARACTIDATVEEDGATSTMQATYTIDLCYAQAKGQDPKNCTETGTLTLTK